MNKQILNKWSLQDLLFMWKDEAMAHSWIQEDFKQALSGVNEPGCKTWEELFILADEVGGIRYSGNSPIFGKNFLY